MSENMSLTLDQAKADIAFLLLRADSAGSCNFTNARWTGMSSNSLVAVAYGGKQRDFPSDRSDYAACVRTFVRLPLHRRTPEVRKALETAREHYLSRYPEDRYPAGRAEKRTAWEARKATMKRARSKTR